MRQALPTLQRILLCLSLVLGSSASLADPEAGFDMRDGDFDMEDVVDAFEVREFHPEFKVRGWGIGRGIHFGQAQIADEEGIGFVVDQGDHQWGFSNKGVAYRFSF